MLNEDKISLMTEMAIYEKRKGKRDLDIFSYFKSDYISWQIIKSIVCATLFLHYCRTQAFLWT